MKRLFYLFIVLLCLFSFNCSEKTPTDISDRIVENNQNQHDTPDSVLTDSPPSPEVSTSKSDDIPEGQDVDLNTQVIFFSPSWKDEYLDFSLNNRGLDRAVEATIDKNIGDAILILTAEKTILIDAGLPGRCKYQIIPQIEQAGRNKIDKLIITHPHFDHYGGGIYLIENYNVDKVFICGTEHPSNAYRYFLQAIAENNVDLYEAKEQQYLDFGLGIEAVVLKSHVPDLADITNYNNHSIYLKMTVNRVSFLFTGDGEYEAEDYLINKGYDLSANILKVGHHGSKSSTFYPFLKRVNPDVAIVTVGKNNAYGLPAQNVMNRIAIFGSKIYRTDYHGTVRVFTDGRTYDVSYDYDVPFEQPVFDIPEDKIHSYLQFESEGKLALRYNRFTSAISNYTAALRIFEDDAVSNQKLGFAYRRLGQHRNAVRFFRQALSIDPDEPYSHFYLGLHYYNINNKRNALNHLTTFRQLMPYSTVSEFVDEKLEDLRLN